MKLTLVVDPPDLREWLTAEDRGALRRCGVNMRQVRATYAGMVEDVLRHAYPNDTHRVEVRKHATGEPVLYGRPSPRARRVTFKLTRKQREVFELCEIAWKASVSQVTLRFAVAAARVRR